MILTMEASFVAASSALVDEKPASYRFRSRRKETNSVEREISLKDPFIRGICIRKQNAIQLPT